MTEQFFDQFMKLHQELLAEQRKTNALLEKLLNQAAYGGLLTAVTVPTEPAPEPKSVPSPAPLPPPIKPKPGGRR